MFFFHLLTEAMKLLTEFHIDISWWNLISKVAFLITFTRERESTRFFPWVVEGLN